MEPQFEKKNKKKTDCSDDLKAVGIVPSTAQN